MQDVKGTAILTIAHIAGSSETPYYAECLLDPKYRAKDYALWAIGVAGDGRAADAVFEYVKKYRKKLSEVSTDPRCKMEIIAFFDRAFGADETIAMPGKEFSFLKDSLVASLAKLPALGTDLFLRRVPGVEKSLRKSQL